MTAFTVASIIAVVIIGLVLVAELVAVTILLLRARDLVQKVRDRVDPVVNESTLLLHKANDVAGTVKDGTQRVTSSVAGLTERMSGVTSNVVNRVDRTTAQMQRVSSATAKRAMSPPFLTAIAILAGIRAAATIQRAITSPILIGLALLGGIPFLLRAWRSLGTVGTEQVVMTTPEGTATLTLRPQRTEEEARIRAA